MFLPLRPSSPLPPSLALFFSNVTAHCWVSLSWWREKNGGLRQGRGLTGVCMCTWTGQGERQTGNQSDGHYAAVSWVKCSILVTQSAVSAPLLAIKPYSLVLVTPLMVFHFSLPKDIFLYTHTLTVVSFHPFMQSSVTWSQVHCLVQTYARETTEAYWLNLDTATYVYNNYI